MGKIKKEKEHSIALAERTKDLVLAAFDGKICEKCGEEPAARIISARFFCHGCAQPSNEMAQPRSVPLPRRWQDQKSWTRMGKD